MSNIGTVNADQLFKGLTRPALLFGVSYSFVIINIMISFLAFTHTTDFRILLLLAPAIHGIGYFASSKEPLFLELLIMRLQKCSKCINKIYHGANSYDVM